MDAYRQRFRPVLLSAPSDHDDRLRRQRESFAGLEEALCERDLAVVEAVGSAVATTGGPECTSDAQALRTRYGIAADRFCILLIGKDGGVKLRSDEPVPAESLFALIDAMPMRRQEMRERDSR
jgi:hypothetical protein